MLERTYNDIVQYMLATNAAEIAEVFARLPVGVAQGLAAELDVAGDVHRYDADAKRVYYFEQQGTNLAVWSWNEVHRPHEAGELIFLVVGSRAPLDERLANEFYTRATQRTVRSPRPPSSNE
jgi:hypothetical protein